MKSKMKITGNDLDRFFKAKGGPLVCSQCRSEDWTVPTNVTIASPDDDLNPFILFPTLYESNGTRTDEGLQILAFTCNNCGNIRLQHLLPVANWLEEQAQE